MRAQLNITQSRSNLVRRLFVVCLAVAAISTSSFSTVTQAAVPPGPVTISLQYFGVTHLGGDKWFADGVVQAQNPEAVVIQFSQAATQSMTPDSGGYFALNFTALAGQSIVVDGTDSTGTVHDQKTLNNFTL